MQTILTRAPVQPFTLIARDNIATPNERPSPRALRKRQRPRPARLRRPDGLTRGRRSRFPGVEARRRLAEAVAPPREALAAAIQPGKRVLRQRSSGTESQRRSAAQSGLWERCWR